MFLRRRLSRMGWMIHGISGCGVVGACGEGRGDVRLGRGDQEMICERAASGVVSFFCLSFHILSLPAPRLWSWWLGKFLS